MEFIIEHDTNSYLVKVAELKNDSRKKIVFTNFGLDEYEISLFLQKEDSSIPVDILTLKIPFQEALGQLLHELLPKIKSFVANPYFDEVMLFFGNAIFTSQDKLKPIQCAQCQLPNLYEKRDKENKKDYINDVKTKLKNNPSPFWPFKGDLMVQIAVSDYSSRLKSVDLDNLIKSVLDSLNDLVLEDDSQVRTLIAEKQSVIDQIAYIVAIRQLKPDEKPKFQEFLFSGDPFHWAEEYKLKQALERPTRFTNY